jgi:hypothetical protein
MNEAMVAILWLRFASLAPAAALLGAFVIAAAALEATSVGAQFHVNIYTAAVQ